MKKIVIFILALCFVTSMDASAQFILRKDRGDRFIIRYHIYTPQGLNSPARLDAMTGSNQSDINYSQTPYELYSTTPRTSTYGVGSQPWRVKMQTYKNSVWTQCFDKTYPVEVQNAQAGDSAPSYDIIVDLTFTIHPDGTVDPVGEEIDDPSDPEIYDLYRWTYTAADNDPFDGIQFTIFNYMEKLNGSEYAHSNGSPPYSYTGSEDILTDGVGNPPDKLWVKVYQDQDVLHDWYAFSFYLVEGETSDTGGLVYECVFNDQLTPYQEGVNPEEPETPPLPIDPTSPPESIGIGDPTPSPTGGDYAAGTALEYEDFRDAMIDALDARKLSQIELETAYQNALIKQQLDADNIQTAMENALKNTGNNPEKTRDAVQNALARQGLSGSNLGNIIGNRFGDELDERDLNAQAIGEAVAGALGTNSYAGIGDNGETPSYDLSDLGEGVITNIGASAAEGSIGGMKSSVESFVSGIVQPTFPQGITAVNGIDLAMGGSVVTLNWGARTEFVAFRAALVWLVHVMFFMGVITIVRRGIA